MNMGHVLLKYAQTKFKYKYRIHPPSIFAAITWYLKQRISNPISLIEMTPCKGNVPQMLRKVCFFQCASEKS
jgi:hypothetical protein